MAKEDNNSEVKSFLGGGTEFNGVLSFEGTVRVDGKFEGEVVSQDILVVGEHANMTADISIGSIIIMGRVSGNVSASKKVEIKEGGQVIGNVKTPSLLVEVGAILDGNCEMLKSEKKISVLPGKSSVEATKKRSSETAA